MENKQDDIAGRDILDDAALIARIKRCKKDGDQHLGEWRKEAQEAYDFVAGEQWSETDKAKLQEMLRAPVVFNRIGAMVDAVGGHEVQNRQQVQYIPRRVGASGINEVLTGAADYIRDNCDAEDEESESFLDAAICGVGVTETSMDYTEEPDGKVLIDRRDPLSCRWDPSAKKRNLTDRRWDQREEWLDREEIEARWPDKAEEIAASQDWGGSDDEGEPHDATLAWLYKTDATGFDDKTGKYRVIHHQWWELESYRLMLNPDTQQLQEISEDDWTKLESRLQVIGMPAPQNVRKQRRLYKQAFVCGDVVLERSNCPCNQFSRKYITAKRDRNRNTWYGIVRAMVDPQRWANKFFSQILHIINTNAKGGLMVEDGATDNIGKLKEDWAKADSVIELNDGALSSGKVQPKPATQYPMAIDNMLTFSISSLRDVSGINLEILGMADRQQAGVLEAQRKQAAMTVLAGLFDALRKYRKEQGRLLAAFIRDYMSDGRLVRIVGGDGTEQYVPLIHDPSVMEYDVVVDEASTTVDRKAQTFQVLMQLMPQLEKAQIPFGPDLLDFLPLPAAMVEKWKQQIKQQQSQPKPPDPQMMLAQAKLMAAQSGAQKVASDAQQSQMEMMLEQQQMPLKMGDLQVQRQELDVRRIEAQVAQLQAIVEGLTAQLQLQQLSGQGVPLGPGMPQQMPNMIPQ